jgi:hypothetical protein
MGVFKLLIFSLSLCSGIQANRPLDNRLLSSFGSQGVNLWKLYNKRASNGHDSGEQRVLGSNAGDPPAHYFEQPLDHFDKTVNKTFGQRRVKRWHRDGIN